MRALNRAAAEVMTAAGVTTATDITGFGLAGHLGEIAAQSGVEVEVFGASIPVFAGVLDLIRAGVISGAVERNREYASAFVRRAEASPRSSRRSSTIPRPRAGSSSPSAGPGPPALLAALHQRGRRRRRGHRPRHPQGPSPASSSAPERPPRPLSPPCRTSTTSSSARPATSTTARAPSSGP